MSSNTSTTEIRLVERVSEFRNPQSAIRNSIPSRHSNPFATCWTRPGAIPYRFPPGENPAQLVRQLAEQRWWGEIVGPHGSGKSTLLARLMPLLRAAGREVHRITLGDGQRSLPRGWVDRALVGGVSGADAGPGSQPVLGVSDASYRILVVDGFEQLAGWRRRWLQWKCRRAGAGLLVTSHGPAGLPPLARTSPDLGLVEQLVSGLVQSAASPVTREDVVASHACHGSNVREILFNLYDRHERRMRAMRTPVARES